MGHPATLDCTDNKTHVVLLVKKKKIIVGDMGGWHSLQFKSSEVLAQIQPMPGDTTDTCN